MRHIVFLAVLVLAACGAPSRPVASTEATLAPELLAPDAWRGPHPFDDRCETEILDAWNRAVTVRFGDEECLLLDPWSRCRESHGR